MEEAFLFLKYPCLCQKIKRQFKYSLIKVVIDATTQNIVASGDMQCSTYITDTEIIFFFKNLLL